MPELTPLDLPPDIALACAPLFDALPLEQAMPHLLGSYPQHSDLVEAVLRAPALANRPALAAGLWLYAGDLERSHAISQGLDDATGAYWHGIMHRREGDFSNGHYWMRRASRHPLRQSRSDLDPDALIDQVAQARRSDPDSDPPPLLARQRAEWQALFAWCAAQPA